MDGSAATGGAVAHGHVGRGRRAWSQLWQVPTFVAGVVAILCVAANAPFRAELREGPFGIELRSLRQGLCDRREPAELIAQAESLLTEVKHHPRREGELHFLAGSAYHRLAESAKNQTAAQTKAVDCLERALAIGVPAADVPALHHRLGTLLYRRRENVSRAVELMAQSVEQGADKPGPAYALLVEAYLNQTPPNLDAALAASQKMLELAGDAESTGQARWLRGDLLVRNERRPEALKELDRITGAISPALRITTRLLQARICAEEGLWHRAAASWKELLADAADVPGGPGRVLYSYGYCLTRTAPPNRELAATVWQQALELNGPARQAAGLRLGELRLTLAPDEPAPALAAWSAALRSIRSTMEYHNEYLDLATARALLEHGCRHFLDRREFGPAQQTAELYKRLAAPGVAEERWADAVEAEAQDWQTRATAGAVEEAALLEKARSHFHRAGIALEQAALVRPEEDQVDLYWRSGQCFLAAKDMAAAANALERFVMHAKDEPRLAQAWYSLAETQAGLGHKEQARQAYYKCIEFPATPFAGRARYQLAVDEMERKNYQHAKEILKQNLTAESPARDRESHEKSLYKMAGLVLQMRAFDEAAWYLKEAARQYPNNAYALVARDRLADCYRALAEETQAKIKELDAVKLDGLAPERKAAIDEMKLHQERTRRQWLEQSSTIHQNLADELKQRAAKRALTNEEASVRRKALFGIADRQFDMDNFTQALQLYERLQQDYSKQVESLIACYGIWRCAGVMVQSPEQIRFVREAAQNAAKTARADLEAMPADSEVFRGNNVWSRAQWLSWLDFVESRLSPTATPVIRTNPLAN
jgi:TolA-binding protein